MPELQEKAVLKYDGLELENNVGRTSAHTREYHMRISTMISVGCVGTWFFLNSLVQPPSGLNDPDFERLVQHGAALQSVANLFLIGAIIAIIVTIYKNLMDKERNEIIQGDKIVADGSIVATRNSYIATGEARIENYTVGRDNIPSKLDEVARFIKKSPLSEMQMKYATLLIENTKRAAADGNQKPEAEGWMKELTEIMSTIGTAGETIIPVINEVRKILLPTSAS